MDCRVSLILGLAVGVLGGAAGCTPSWFSRSSTTDPGQTTSLKQTETPPVAAAPPLKEEKETPRRRAKVSTVVAFGDFRLRESMSPKRTPAEQRQLRDEARRAYRKALQSDPNCYEAQRGLAQVYAVEKEDEKAIQAFQGALRLRPKEPGLYYELGMAHGRRKEWDRSIEALSRAVELDQDNREYARTLGLTLARAGRFEQSLAYLSRVLGEAKAHYYVGRMMLHVGQTEAGKVQLEMSLRLDPKRSEARRLLAEAETKQGRGVVPVNYEEKAQP